MQTIRLLSTPSPLSVPNFGFGVKPTPVALGSPKDPILQALLTELKAKGISEADYFNLGRGWSQTEKIAKKAQKENGKDIVWATKEISIGSKKVVLKVCIHKGSGINYVAEYPQQPVMASNGTTILEPEMRINIFKYEKPTGQDLLYSIGYVTSDSRLGNIRRYMYFHKKPQGAKVAGTKIIADSNLLCGARYGWEEKEISAL